MITLDLLPPEQKQVVRLEQIVRQWQRAVVVAAVLAVVVTAGLLVGLVTLEGRAHQGHATLTALQAEVRKNASSDITTQTNLLNTTVKAMSVTLGASQDWSAALAQALNVLPAHLTLNSVTLSPGRLVKWEGLAATRQDFLTLDQTLKSSSQLTKVSTTSVPSLRIDVPFVYQATLAVPK